ncbi:ribokinase [Pseudalkalibacillus caeni]|uniref:Ribokinase n=1 Tax=Exobacillus caeni TaxID=2574798 RepID=A0A5R9F482_9BACL|nr:ribokinase [Pseudalkalibacillus caeni]TLS38387.1 ribokinase [Pseudalkalibacillus caeni]
MNDDYLLVVGSINMDIMTFVSRHPFLGETIKGEQVTYTPGGKGANQAVSAAQTGSKVMLMGAVGNDHFQENLTSNLLKYNIPTDFVVKKEMESSGIAFITVGNSGENTIIIYEGANGKLNKEEVDLLLSNEENMPSAVLLQNEIPWEVNEHILGFARYHGIKTYYNPAPAFSIPTKAFNDVDVLIVNETEAVFYTGVQIKNREDITYAMKRLLDLGVKEVILTLGEHGCIYSSYIGENLVIPGVKVKVVDTTGAGDTFIGAFASQQQKGENLKESLEYASIAAAITCTKQGAQNSMPTDVQIRMFQEKQRAIEINSPN